MSVMSASHCKQLAPQSRDAGVDEMHVGDEDADEPIRWAATLSMQLPDPFSSSPGTCTCRNNSQGILCCLGIHMTG